MTCETAPRSPQKTGFGRRWRIAGLRRIFRRVFGRRDGGRARIVFAHGALFEVAAVEASIMKSLAQLVLKRRRRKSI